MAKFIAFTKAWYKAYIETNEAIMRDYAKHYAQAFR